MKIPIKKHTKVRRPKSIYHTIIIRPGEWMTQSFGVEPLVKDISKGLENPLLLRPKADDTFRYDPNKFADAVLKQQKGDWNDKDMEEVDNWEETFNGMREKATKWYPVSNYEYYKVVPKPSLLTKLKNRFKK